MGCRFRVNDPLSTAPPSGGRRERYPSISPIIVFLLSVSIALIEAMGANGSRLVRGVKARGSCAITDMSGNQSQLIALQRARAAAIEEAAGISIGAATL